MKVQRQPAGPLSLAETLCIGEDKKLCLRNAVAVQDGRAAEFIGCEVVGDQKQYMFKACTRIGKIFVQKPAVLRQCDDD